jgi:hypothetical protein
MAPTPRNTLVGDWIIRLAGPSLFLSASHCAACQLQKSERRVRIGAQKISGDPARFSRIGLNFDTRYPPRTGNNLGACVP